MTELTDPEANDIVEPTVEIRTIERILRARRDREAVFGGDLFADPAWDMLLELYMAGLRNERLATSALCAASGVPITTALRWIEQLAGRRWIARVPDRTDARRMFVELSSEGTLAMRQWLHDWEAGQLP